MHGGPASLIHASEYNSVRPGLAYIVMVYLVMGYLVMGYLVMGYLVMGYLVMGYIVMGYIVMAHSSVWSGLIVEPGGWMPSAALRSSAPPTADGPSTNAAFASANSQLEPRFIFDDLSAHADGERRWARSNRRLASERSRVRCAFGLPSD